MPGPNLEFLKSASLLILSALPKTGKAFAFSQGKTIGVFRKASQRYSIPLGLQGHSAK
jgi:hypothetical protein